ncbi:hypothetical protein D3C84_1140740 [compost metagenome]
MFRNLDQKVDLRLGREPRNGGASDMMDGNKLSAECLRDLLFGVKKERGPSTVIGGNLAG